MKRIQYRVKFRLQCKNCNHDGYPYVKMIRFKTSKEYSVSAHCQKCGKWIQNVKMQDVEERKMR